MKQRSTACGDRRQCRPALALPRCILPILQINRPLALSAWHLVSALSKGLCLLIFLSFDQRRALFAYQLGYQNLIGVPLKLMTFIIVTITSIHSKSVYLISY